MQLFAIIAKQDVGLSVREREFVQNFLKQQLNESSVNEYLALFDSYFGDRQDIATTNPTEQERPRLTSVKDSVKTLGIAKKINKTLTQKQKVVVLVRLFELVNSDKNFTAQRMAIIDTAAEVFNIGRDEYNSISAFVINKNTSELNYSDILIVGAEEISNNTSYFIHSPQLSGNIFILRVNSVDLYFFKYTGDNELLLNGLTVNNQRIYLFANGSVLKQPKGKPIFFTDVAAQFLADSNKVNTTFRVENISYVFPNGNIGLREIRLQEQSGKMVAIMGGSGTGKTTLLNVLSGIDNPTGGNVFINGIDLHQEKERVKGIIGYIPQDDLLIEELTVYENLYYSTKLVYRDLNEEEVDKKVTNVLSNLGLYHIRHLKVGSPLNKKISGGQRKRLNIGLELVREPAVMFVDEPTSGLSSRDSENVMELLRELTVRGKLIFTVIHQPSSEIFKMFDSIVILDEGGYQIYYGNPVEAVIYFKRLDNQINSSVGECPRCGNVNPETIFNIIESGIVDEYGRPTGKRKVKPVEWSKHLNEVIAIEASPKIFDSLPETSKKPNWLQQLKIFFSRDLFSKLSNTQYLVLNLLEAPVLAFLMAYVLRYIDDPTSDIYVFRDNENIMPFIFMCTIVAMFLGLIVSAEEIFKDRKILKRESFLNLSRSSYLISKIGILFIISAIQAILFVLIGNYVLGIKGMNLEYWLIFFSLSALANVIGLNISSAFNSAVTIYILIPFLIIPQMVLTGAMFRFDKINRTFGGGQEKVPVIAEVMPSRWAFEALVVNQYMNNDYMILFYDDKKIESAFNFKNVYYIPELRSIVDDFRGNVMDNESIPISEDNLELLYNELKKENNSPFVQYHNIRFNHLDKINPTDFNMAIADSITVYLFKLQEFYRKNFNHVNNRIDETISYMISTPEGRQEYQRLYNDYYNTFLGQYVQNSLAPLPMVRLDNNFVQKIDPIFLDPQDRRVTAFRSHFLAPNKNLFGYLVPTFYFNLMVIWIFTILSYIALYYNGLARLLNSFSIMAPKLSYYFNNLVALLKSSTRQFRKINIKLPKSVK